MWAGEGTERVGWDMVRREVLARENVVVARRK